MSNIAKIIAVASDPTLGESGGGHNQKGVDFQRYWAISRIIQLEESGAQDFLILIEALQDVAEFDNSKSPSRVSLYQLKKKDRNEWSWIELTKVKKPTKHADANFEQFSRSPIGKLVATMVALDGMEVDGKFISNKGCNLPLATGGNAATTHQASFDDLPDTDKAVLIKAVGQVCPGSDPQTLLSKLRMEKVSIPVDDPRTHLIGVAHQFLEARSPSHAAQAGSFIDALMAIIGPLGAKTDTYSSFEELCAKQGYSRTRFLSALGDLESVPDLKACIDFWMHKLSGEGLGVIDHSAIRIEIAAILRRGLMSLEEPEPELITDCDQFLIKNPIATDIKPIIEKGYESLKDKYINLKRPQILAQFILRAIKCVDQI